MSALTVGSLFSGIGGFDLGLERAGVRPLWMCEIDQACQGVLRRHWPGVPIYDDVTRLSADNVVRPDVLCGGFPCQDVSVAGRRAGLAGERSGLWYEFLRVIESLRPRWVVIENVPGLLSSNGGRDFAVVLRGLVECGYGVTWRVLDAQYFGVAQRRRRVFIVGSLGSGRAAQVLFEREGVPGDTPPRRETGQRVARSLANSSVSSGYRYDPNGEEYVIAFQERGREGGRSLEHQDGVAYALTAPNGGGRRQEMNIAYGWNGDTTPKFSAECRTILRAEQGGEGVGVVGLQMNFIRRPRVGDYVGSLSAQPGDAQFNGLWDMRCGVRRLTPVECERLQGFPDHWTAHQSDSVRYRQLGNAVCVNVAEWIGRRIMEADTA